MPTAYVDVPPGLGTEPKTKLVKEITDLIHHAYLHASAEGGSCVS